ncbi:hypothetical protein M1D89_00950 (plasmid) [Arthrobacter sp. D3-18]
MQSPLTPVEVLVTIPEDRHVLLSEAENKLQQEALLRKAFGILVTRHNLHKYSLELSAEVPFGETRERSIL